jgi:glycosyltransferase involved in cell wall biosynthesis
VAANPALVHDWLVTAGGGESVLAEALTAFPGAPVHALIDHMTAADHARLGIPSAHTSWMQGIPGVARRYRSLLPLMPAAVRSLRIDGPGPVLAISHAVAKAAPVREDQALLCLCLSPMRYAWDLREQYLEESGLSRGVKGALARAVLERMRRWDERTAARVDAYASISRYIADRVRRAYGRESEVIYPPVDTDYYNYELGVGSSQLAVGGAGGVYVTASRFVPYKRVDLIVRAFAAMPDRKLVVIGDGPDDAKVRAAGAPNVTFIGRASREVLRDWLRAARAFVFAAEEDFGIAPVEAQACGTPVIAFGRGGALETVVDGTTGLFFAVQAVESIREAVDRFERNAFDPAACRANAERFSAPRFRAALVDWVLRNRQRTRG